MGSGELTPLQVRVLKTLASLQPPWTLTGGGALVGFHLHHRTTRDLDLFVHGRATLEDYALRATELLQQDGMQARSLQAGPSMHRLLVSGGSESVVLDLVSDPVPVVEPPVERSLDGIVIRVDSEHEILVNKLCTLVQRSELRDLFDVQELLGRGGDLHRALVDAPKKDGGFSPLTLAWILEKLPLETLGRAEDWQTERIDSLVRFRALLLEKLTDEARPDES